MASYYRRVAAERLGKAAGRARRLAAVFEQLANDAVADEGTVEFTPVSAVALSSPLDAAEGNRVSGVHRWWPVLAAAGIVCLVVAGLFSLNPPAKPAVSLTGTVTDSLCGQHHTAEASAACVRNCVRQGAKYVLYDGMRLYQLGDQHLGERVAGQKVNIRGVLDRMTYTVQVSSIKPAS